MTHAITHPPFTIEPDDDDVLFGRGVDFPNHPGNIRFRQKVLELKSRYDICAQENDYRIAQVLVDSFKNAGHRFLEMGYDGMWHVMINGEAKAKARHAFEGGLLLEDRWRVILNDPKENDVLFGRSRNNVTHPGNIRFREKVLELKLWYEASTDEEKIQIAQILIVSLKGAGYRFLEEINDGVWHELTNNEAREMEKHALGRGLSY